MSCVLLTVLLHRIDIATGIKIQMTSFENKDIRKSVIFQINTATRFFKAFVFTVYIYVTMSEWIDKKKTNL